MHKDIVDKLSNEDESPATASTGQSQDVAVIGLACRLPGDNNSPEELWDFLASKSDACSEIPPARWEAYRRRDGANPRILANITKRGYFVDGMENFDAAFFGISPKEAEQLDPQQRMSLEVAWEALEHAGIPPYSLAESDTAVFMGVNTGDYGRLILEDLNGIEPWMGIGTASCGVSNRISYTLDLKGPSSTVDAACASSLVAIHHGRTAILRGESKIAIVGGVNAMCSPSLTHVLDKAGVLSPDGRCHCFDDHANGYGRGEGSAVIVLKAMSLALEDGDDIIAVLKGSAVAHGGRTHGIMAPNPEAQKMVALQALTEARVDPAAIQFIEAHATSTAIGDPAEVTALASVYGRCRQAGKPCYIGSVKGNVGHLEAGAGAVGFIKACLSIQRGMLLPQANLATLNRKVNWAESGLHVVQELQDWPASKEDLRRAAVCSYGNGGSVSHAILEQHIPLPPAPICSAYPSELTRVLLLSAPSAKGLTLQAETLKNWLAANGRAHSLSSISATLTTQREFHAYRAAFLVSAHDGAQRSLEAFVDGGPNSWTCQNRVLGASPPDAKPVAWVFSGHGAQWPEMAKSLIHLPVFYKAIAPLDPVVSEELDFSPIEAMRTGSFGVLEANGLRCQVALGQSVGEIAAAVIAGCLTPKEGAMLVSHRARLYRQFMGSGAMLLVNSPWEELRQHISESSNLVRAIDSSPYTCVISGSRTEIEQFREDLLARGIQSFRVRTDIAFHHPMLQVLAEPLSGYLDTKIAPRPARIQLYSTTLRDPRGTSLRDSQYWVKNMISPVLLSSAVGAAAEDGIRCYLEISSHPIVSESTQQILLQHGENDYIVTNTMTRQGPAEESILYSLCQLHCGGARIDWERQVSEKPARGVPTTKWNHKRVWRHVRTSSNQRTTHDPAQHDLLGPRIALADEQKTIFTTVSDERSKPFPGDHPVLGCEVIPAAVLVNTFFQATGAQVLRDIDLRLPITTQPRHIQVVVEPGEAKIYSSLVNEESSNEQQAWLTHASACWEMLPQERSGHMAIDLAEVASRMATKLDEDFTISYLERFGVQAMGFPWKVKEHKGGASEMFVEVDIAGESDGKPATASGFLSWAALLDAAASTAATIFLDEPCLRMPAHIDSIRRHTVELPSRICYLHITRATSAPYATNVVIADSAGKCIATIEAIRFCEPDGEKASRGIDSLVHHLAWPPATYNEKPLTIERMILIGDDESRLVQYSNQVKARSLRAVELCAGSEQFAMQSDLVLENSAIVYVPSSVLRMEHVKQQSQHYALELLAIVKTVYSLSASCKVFCLTERVVVSDTLTALAHSTLHGLSRIISGELPEIWGGLIDVEYPTFPLEVIKYVHGHTEVRISDGIPRVPMLRPLQQERRIPPGSPGRLLPRPGGIYLITGGLGSLGMEIARFLVAKGARRLVLVSRRALPVRSEWGELLTNKSPMAPIINHILELESKDVTIATVSCDLSSPSASESLSAQLDALPFPTISGVVHAAGVLEDQLILSATSDSFERVLAPKASGSLMLHRMFPPGTLDFFILFSSCGHLFGFPGQGSYASGNSFLNSLATHRQSLGDNAIAIQWTCWRGMGMAASPAAFLDAELAAKGITDISRDEAYRAWEYLSQFRVDNAVVVHALELEANEPLASPVLGEIAVRKCAPTTLDTLPLIPAGSSSPSSQSLEVVATAIADSVATVLQLDPDDVDYKVPLSSMGLDSVMTAHLRTQLRKALGLQVPPTLTWSHPTIERMASWCWERLQVE